MLFKIIVFSQKQNKWLACQFYSKKGHVAETSPIHDYFQKYFRLEVNVLRCHYNDAETRIYEVEIMNECLSENTPLVWTNPEYITDKVFIKEKHRSIPWFQHGWREEMEAWVKKYITTRPLHFEQIRSWERSALFRIYTNKDNYYFKAVPDIFSHEPQLQQYLAYYHPHSVPDVLAVDEQKNGYIMQELNGDLLGYSKKMSHWEKVLPQIADIQKQSIKYKHWLQISVRPLVKTVNDGLENTLDALLNEGSISQETYLSLKRSIPLMLFHVKRLEESNLPLALDHGDLFGGNVIVQNDQPVIFDWSDSSLTHPFLSVIVLLEEVEALFSTQVSEHFLRVYLKNWTAFDTLDCLHREFEYVRVLAPLFYLVVHQRFIFPAFVDNLDKQEIIDHYVNKWLMMIKG